MTESGNGKDTALEIAQPQSMLLAGSPEQVLELVRKRQQVLAVCRTAAITSTKPHQWIRFGDGERMHPTAAAISAMITQFGVCIINQEHAWEEGTDDDGPWYLCRYKADFEVPGLGLGRIGATGTAHSRDQFLTQTKSGPDLRAAVLKKAQTNCHYRGVTTMLCINVTAEELDYYLGQGQSKKAGHVKFQKGGRGGGGVDMTGIKIPFGKAKGLSVEEAQTSDLAWLRTTIEKSIADPEKARWRDNNQRLLDAITGELTAREQAEAGADYETGEVHDGAPAGDQDKRREL